MFCSVSYSDIWPICKVRTTPSARQRNAVERVVGGRKDEVDEGGGDPAERADVPQAERVPHYRRDDW
jgi:hypothetical protein